MGNEGLKVGNKRQWMGKNGCLIKEAKTLRGLYSQRVSTKEVVHRYSSGWVRLHLTFVCENIYCHVQQYVKITEKVRL